jgi:hypothetical protein
MLRKNNTNLPQFLGFFCGFLATYILVDQKPQIGYNSYTVAKQEQVMRTVKVMLVQRRRVAQFTLPQTPEAQVIRAQLRAKLTQALSK